MYERAQTVCCLRNTEMKRYCSFSYEILHDSHAICYWKVLTTKGWSYENRANHKASLSEGRWVDFKNWFHWTNIQVLWRWFDGNEINKYNKYKRVILDCIQEKVNILIIRIPPNKTPGKSPALLLKPLTGTTKMRSTGN